MSTITYENIKVNGAPIERVLELHIQHAPNAHGTAQIKGIAPYEGARDFAERADETTGIEITTTAEGQPGRLFYGVISNLSIEQQPEYAVIDLSIETTSGRLDAKKCSRTFQNTQKTYGQILNQIMAKNGTVSVMVSDKPIGALIMQCDETDWEFTMRMASQLGVPAFANIIAQTAQIYIGLPPAGQSKAIETFSYDYAKSDTDYQSVTTNNALAASAMREDFSSEQVHSYDYLYLGDTVTLNGRSSQVSAVRADLVDGILECTYSLSLKTGFRVPEIRNQQASGRMMTGIVTKVEADRVQVFLNSVDSEPDKSSDWWFPYSTAYSSQDGSGWYSMPAENDEVRVFFPSGNEADAFAASSVAKNVRENVTDKCWSGLNGKQILMTQDGIAIISKEGKLYLKLNDKKGIEIISDLDINITSGTRVTIQGGDAVEIIAKNEVMVGTASSYMDIRNEGITVSSKNIILN